MSYPFQVLPKRLFVCLFWLAVPLASWATDEDVDKKSGPATQTLEPSSQESAVAPAAPLFLPASLGLEQAVEKALEGNPGLAKMRARASAMAAVPSQVGSLPDPRLNLGAMNVPTDTFDLDQENMTQMQVGLSQMFPFPGKLGLKEAAAKHESLAAAADVEETRLGLIRNVKKTWWQLYFLDRALEITNRNQELLRQFVDIARTKYKVGQGLQQDVLLAQVELSKLLDKELELNGMRRTQEAWLNALMNRPTSEALRLPDEVKIDLPPVPTEVAMHALADGERPLLAARQQKVDAARKRLKLARKNYLPDFMLGASYGNRQGYNPNGTNRADFASVMFSMTLPLYAWRKQRMGVVQRTNELTNRELALRYSWEKVQAEISQANADYTQSRDQVELFENGIIPQARQTVDSMLAGYQVNKVDFLNLVRSQITLFKYETLYWKAVSAANQALAKLDAAVGKEMLHEYSN
ncbi:MAG TPA: TolC family protein [Acidiferrobacteraceae bacterium]|nr:TolC family protein [Acidiferrobacteraceae bacterium]